MLTLLPDNKELTPEFYFGDGSFLKNTSKAELGVNHLGEKVNDVSLPPWASSAADFVLKNRYALESNYASAHLHKWIDLVFGYLQKGERAQFANNLFRPETLEDNVDFSKITSSLQLEALTAQIRQFGQCPRQLFPDKPHAPRLVRTISIDPRSGTRVPQMNAEQAPAGDSDYVQTLQQELLQAK